MGVMTASQVIMGPNVPMVDFTEVATATYGTAARMEFANGKMGFWAGNSVNDGRLKYTGTNNDRDPILVTIDGSIPTMSVPGYFTEDVDMDGFVRFTGAGNDRDRLLLSLGGMVPNAVRVEQVP